MNWDNIFKLLETYTQLKHYQILFDKYGLAKKGTRRGMLERLNEVLVDTGLLEPAIDLEEFAEWLSLHQIDGNNHTYVYNIENKPSLEFLQELHQEKENYIDMKLWEIDPDNKSEELYHVMENLDDIKLIGISRDEDRGEYIFSFISPCIVSGIKVNGDSRLYKKIFFCHCVLFDNSDDMKIIFNPTTNTLNVNGMKKGKKGDWSPIANMFFHKVRTYIGNCRVNPPNWTPEALFRLAEDATNHNNPEINRRSLNAQATIEVFASHLLKIAGVDVKTEEALKNRFIQDVQLSFESQLIEKYGYNEEEESFSLFRQRSDGITHTVNVESREEGFRAGSAAQAAKRSRQDGDVDLLGVILNTENCNYKFFVEYASNAYVIRGTNTFVEEEVVNIVIRKINEYRRQIQIARQ
ncbi:MULTISPECIES: hypothetical protein [Bacillus cereus group]|uniref:hypothetical protein n=1 Tax=Bacillus cereus group TaxID=86661 RepID=UPI0022E2C7E2|nr:hypothetical protein [Bacillus cereus group sp. BY105LC]MDA1887245.1 hypothetical protein [Bacillus cereus group sp. BY105LC]